MPQGVCRHGRSFICLFPGTLQSRGQLFRLYRIWSSFFCGGDVQTSTFRGSRALSPQTRYIVPILDGTEVPKSVLLYFDATTKPKNFRTLCYSKLSDFPCFVLLPNQKFRPVGLQNTNRNAQCKRPAGKNYLQITNAPRPQVVVYTNNTESTQLRACATWYVHVVLLAEYPCKL